MTTYEQWWQRAVIYQIYPRSFQDSNGDGIGDLPGITNRLDYLAWLGIDAIWISPVYPSPMADFGYDVSDYTDIHPVFGTLEDMKTLIKQAHERNLRIILDYVPSHTSNQHPWFLESRSSLDNPKRDWYIWKKPAPDGGPPNNWLSRFDGASAWEWDPMTEQFYLHTFLKEQPDLNWRNPDVKSAMLDVMRFWFDLGVDGLRIDVAYRVMKDASFRDNPLNTDWKPGMDPFFKLGDIYTKNTPDNHLFNHWVRSVADEYENKVLIGEMNLTLEELIPHYGSENNPELHLPFNFRLLFSPWGRDNVRALVTEYEKLLPAHAWPNWVLSNHDQHRFASRAGADQARAGMLFLLTVRGTPTMYYGEELGLQNVPIPDDMVQDPWEIFTPNLGLGRDPERTPMRWRNIKNADFCPPEGKPWLPIGPDLEKINVATQKSIPTSMLSMTRELISLRHDFTCLQTGAIRLIDTPEDILGYERFDEHAALLVLLNFSAKEQVYQFQENQRSELLFSSRMQSQKDSISTKIQLHPNEGVILKILTDS